MAIELENVASGYSTGIINDNFQRIEEYVNENLLNRDGLEEGEANQLETPLDTNSNSIYNLPKATRLHEAVPLWQILEIAAPDKCVHNERGVARSITRLDTPPDNGGQQSSGMTEESPWEELVRRVAKNDAALTRFALPGQRMGSVIFTPTQESLTMGFAPIPGSPDTGRSLIPCSQIRTMFLDGHVGKALFTPTSLAGNGVASFRYNGRVPLTGVMSGHLRVARRVAASGSGAVDMWLRLSAVSGIPSYDRGQGDGSQLISYSPAYMDAPSAPFQTTDAFADFPTRPTQEMWDALANEPDINPGSVEGWIGSSQLYANEGDNGLLPPGYPGSSEGDDLRTTGWFPVEPGDALMLWPLNGTATGLRLHIRRVGTEDNWFVRERSSMSESPFTLLIPERRNSDYIGVPPWEARIYWHRDGDTADELVVKKIPDPNMLTTAWWGVWALKEFPVCRDIVFWPGAEYRFSFTSRAHGVVGTGPNYIRVASGGLRFDFDATELYSDLLDLYANKVCKE